jgi:arylsulfatase A-like enzyme
VAQRWWASESGRPKFLFLNFIDPHSPYGDPHPFRNIFLDETTSEAPDISNDSEDYDAGLLRASGVALERVTALYDADIRFLDSCLESLCRWLGKRQELDRSIIIITADHGERLGERGLLGHQLGLDNVLLHVPLIIRYPRLVKAGRFPAPVQSHHVYKMLLELLNPGLLGDSPKEERESWLPTTPLTLAQMRYQGQYLDGLGKRNPSFDRSPFQGDWNSASDGRWKLYLSDTGRICLYDLAADPAEEDDLEEKVSPEVQKFLAAVSELPKFESGKKPREIPADVAELLRSLGYVHR